MAIPVHLLPSISPLAWSLDRERAARVPECLERHANDVATLDRLLSDDAPAESLAEPTQRIFSAFQNMRLSSFYARIGGRIDRLLRTRRREILDFPEIPNGINTLGMAGLQWINRALGSYELWARTLEQMFATEKNLTVHELTCGTGGFARHLALRKQEATSLRVQASDLRPSNIERARAAALRQKADVHFEVRNAFELTHQPSEVDLFLSTQAIHHLEPHQVVKLIHQATQVAPEGLVIVDLLRSLTGALSTAAMVTVLMPFPVNIIDGVLSVCRAYNPAELELLTRLAGAGHVKSQRVGPVHYFFHAQRSREFSPRSILGHSC